MGGAHRKPATTISTPAITQHLVYWVPDEYADVVRNQSKNGETQSDGVSGKYTDKRIEWVCNIEEYIWRLYNYLQEKGCKPETPSFSVSDNGNTKCLALLNHSYKAKNHVWEKLERISPGTRYKIVRISFVWESMPVTVSFELHNEYFTVSTGIDLSRWSDDKTWPDPSKPPGRNARLLSAAIRKFNDFATERYKEADRSRKRVEREGDDRLLEIPFFRIYRTVWRSLHSQIFSRPFKEVGINKLNGVCADFRYFIVTRDAEQFMLLPGNYKKDVKLEKDRFSPAAYRNCVETIRPFLKLSAGPQLPEYTFSRLLQGACVHGSALGATPIELERDKKPVMDLLIFTHSDKWQIGRLIDRGNTLGTLRIAALYDIDNLNAANVELRKLEEEVEAAHVGASKAITRNEKIRRQIDSDEDPKDETKILNEISNFNKTLLTLSETNIKGGLPYRVERSRYYRQQFLDLITALRIRRIEGSQPYDEYVDRRLSATYDFIRMVGVRYVRVQQTIAALNRQLTNRELLRLQERIHDWTVAIGKVQEHAEVLFFLILCPYYASSVLIHIFRAAHFSQTRIGWDVEKAILFAVTTISLACAVSAPTRRWLKDQPKKDRSRLRLLAILCIFVFALALAIIGFLITNNPEPLFYGPQLVITREY
jgi:hypothetical protein